MMGIKHGALAIMAPLLGIAWYWAHTGSTDGFDFDSIVSGLSCAIAGFGSSVSNRAIQAGTSVLHGNLMYMSGATQPQMAHMLSLLIFSLMAIWAL